MNKKGISPLISTVILLVFATGLGLVVMNWGNAVSVEPEGNCETKLDLVEINQAKQICRQDNSIKMMLENNGHEEITAVKISIIDDQGIINDEVNETIKTAEIKQLEISSSRDTSLIRKIKITPKTNEYCPDSSLEVENIGVCE